MGKGKVNLGTFFSNVLVLYNLWGLVHFLFFKKVWFGVTYSLFCLGVTSV